jgi:hypothetical protein
MSTTTSGTDTTVRDGMRVRNGVSPNHQPSFLMINNRAHLLNDRDTELNLFGNTDSVPVSPLVVEIGAAIGVAYLAKAPEDPRVYLVYDGYKRWIPSPAVFEEFAFRWESIREVPAQELDKIPNGPDVG